jgi:hypothetical protein
VRFIAFPLSAFLHIHLVDDIRNSDIATDPTARWSGVRLTSRR